MKKLNKKLLLLLTIALASSLVLGIAGCSKAKTDDADAGTDKPAETVKLVVGASPVPHAEILNNVKATLAEQGVELEVKEYSDYILPNTALQEGEIDANFFQHVPYLTDFNAENSTDLVPVTPVHFEPLGVYPGKSTAALADIKDGAQIAIDNDATNEARSLQLLQAEGLITLKEGVGLKATPKDVTDNPHKIKFIEAEAANLPRLLEDADYAVINGNYALSAGLDISTVLAKEDPASEAAQTYANVLVVKAGNESSEAILKLQDALTSEVTRAFIADKYAGAVVPVF